MLPHLPIGHPVHSPSSVRSPPSALSFFVYHLRATRTPPHLHTLTPSNFRTLKSQVSCLKYQISALSSFILRLPSTCYSHSAPPSYLNTFQLSYPQVSSLKSQVSGLFPQASSLRSLPLSIRSPPSVPSFFVYPLRTTRTPSHLPTSNNQPSTPIKESFQQPCSLTCPEGTRFTHPQV